MICRTSTRASPKSGAGRAWNHRRRDLVRTFSRGMQQRLAIGRAVLHDPEVMLFDEPYTGLDQDASAMLDDVLRNVAARGRTVVMTSHDLARAEDLASRFDILSRGVIAASLHAAGTRVRATCSHSINRRWRHEQSCYPRRSFIQLSAVFSGLSAPSPGRTWRPSCARANCSRPCWSFPCWSS